MDIMKKLSGKNFFVFNLVLLGTIFGFTAAFLTFSCAKGGGKVQAQEARTAVPVPQEALAVAEGLQTAFRSISDKVLPSVVELKTVSIRRQTVPNFNGIPWEFFFGTPNEGGNSVLRVLVPALSSAEYLLQKSILTMFLPIFM